MPLMNERPIALKATGMIGCSYQDHCKARKICGRLGLDVEIGQVPVDPDAKDLGQADSDLHVLAIEWGNVSESECIRPDNFKQGEPVIVFRVGSYVIDRVYK